MITPLNATKIIWRFGSSVLRAYETMGLFIAQLTHLDTECYSYV